MCCGIKFESLVLWESQMIRETYLAHTNDGIRWFGFSVWGKHTEMGVLLSRRHVE